MRRHIRGIVDRGAEVLKFCAVPHFRKGIVFVEAEKLFGRRHARADVTVRTQKQIAPAYEAIFVRLVAGRIFARQMRQLYPNAQLIANFNRLLKNFSEGFCYPPPVNTCGISSLAKAVK